MATAGMPTSCGPHLAAKFGALSYRATQQWVTWASEQLARRTERASAGS